MCCLARLSFILAGAGTLAFALLLAPAGPAPSHAADPPLAVPEPDLTYRVVNVSADDVLNVRDQPGTAAPVLATLPQDATGVVVTGVRQPVGAAMWWEIIHPGIERDRGWVNAGYLAAEDVEPQADFPLLCVGTEPFWSLAIEDDLAEFELMGEAPTSWEASPRMDAAGFRAGHRFAVRLDRASPAATGWAAVSRPVDYCSDHMSDNLYPYDLIVVTPDADVFSGCCSRAP